MARHRRPGGVPRSTAALLAGLAVAGTLAVSSWLTAAPPVGGPSAPLGGIAAGALPATDDVAEPVAIRIPRIRVDGPLIRLGTDPAGVLQPPATADVAGWYAGGSAPGAPGPAVIAGHVSSRETGPGVFHDLHRLAPGDPVEVRDARGRWRTFAVQTVNRVDKSAFPTQNVYGPTPVPELRLITCGGSFDREAGSYPDNVIVSAIPG